MLNVFLVDDSPLALEVLKKIVESNPDNRVIYKATDGEEAVKLIPQLKPNIVCLDYFMPKLNGVKLVKQIMEVYPLPILVISGVISDQNSKEIFDVLQAGALDFIPKPSSYDSNSDSAKKLLEKIKVLSNVMVVKRVTAPTKEVPQPYSSGIIGTSLYEIVVIGSSTGGPSALQNILHRLPKKFPAPILCIQHISKGFLTAFKEWLSNNCQLDCKVITDKEKLVPGTVYLAPEDKNISFNIYKHAVLENPPFARQCPCIDISMESAARIYGQKALGILLTGMGADGAQGMLSIRKAGGGTIAQSEESCVVFGMPKEAITLGAASRILDLEEIGTYLLKTFHIQ